MALYPLPSGKGNTHTIVGNNPAANAELSDVVPGNTWWYLVSVSVALVQGITQTPQPILSITDQGGNVCFEAFGASAAQAVSTTCQYTWASELSLTAVVGATTNCHANGPLPQGLILGPGYTIATKTIGIGGNTDYGAPVYLVCALGG